ncbi:ABC transporter substrate-binding protein [uncultured Amnibacterium sp.]|uniref:ABC transporter substrate-binding protein n=1 Tax=uncultured Amnibacterium sp. TaxID=1631851 RepID=UPI0035CAE36D
MGTSSSPTPFTRRTVLRTAGAGAGALALADLLAACGIKGGGAASGDTLKIGFVSPQTGALASFASSDSFVVKTISALTSKGFTAGGSTKQLQIVVKDTQSSPTRASDVTRQLITQDKVDLVVASGTPDTTNPVADACEAAGIPNITTIAPWEAWFFGRNGKDGVGFEYSTLFFFGMQQFGECFFPMWEKVGADGKDVACLWPDDTDANAFRNGLGPAMKKDGYTPIDGGKYNDGASDFTGQIAKFTAAKADLFTCTPIPPDFQTYWKQAAQQGFRPKLATVAKVMLFPSEAEALGTLSNNIATDIWWSPGHPYRSTLDGSSAAKLADAFAASAGKQWTQALGSVYSLFEIAIEAFKQASDPRDRKDVADKLKKMSITGMSGPLDFTKGPQPGVAIQHPVGGQWRPGKTFPWDITIVDNSANTAVPLQGDLQPTFA